MAPSAVDVASSDAATTSTSYDPARPLAGKVALITGAGRGIGRGIAIELGRRGANVVVADLPSSRDAAAALIRRLPPGPGGEAAFLPVDILDWGGSGGWIMRV